MPLSQLSGEMCRRLSYRNLLGRALKLYERLGVLGGAFDPPHYGHLLLAQASNLEKVMFVPTGTPVHKKVPTSAMHRLAMTELAIQDNDDFVVSGVEVYNPNPSFTLNTLRRLSKQADSLVLLLGEDQRDLPGWHHRDEILDEVEVLVMDRLGPSSTLVRESLREGLPIRYLVPPAVEEYIYANAVYAQSPCPICQATGKHQTILGNSAPCWHCGGTGDEYDRVRHNQSTRRSRF